MKKLKIKAKNFNKKRSAKIQKRKQKGEIKKIKRIKKVEDIPKKPTENIAQKWKIEESIADNINYLSLCIATDCPYKMKDIFDKDLNLLSEQNIDIHFLRGLINTFTLANGIEYSLRNLNDNIYSQLYKAFQSREVLEIKRKFIKKTDGITSDKFFALYTVKYLYEIFEYIINTNCLKKETQLEIINVPAWAEDFYEYCQDSYIWDSVKAKTY